MIRFILGALAALTCLCSSAQAAAPQTLRRLHVVNTVVIPPPVNDLLRSNQRQWLDVSTDIATMADDATHPITVSVAGGSAISLKMWNSNTLAAGDSSTVVKRQLLDNLSVQTSTCTDGASLGAISISGTTAGGAPVNASHTYTCDTDPILTWNHGALTPAQGGGPDLKTDLGFTCLISDCSDWTLAAADQTINGQLVLRRDLANSVARIVVAGTAPGPGSASGGGWSGWTGAASGPVAGTTSTATLRNSVSSAAVPVAINFIALQYDAAVYAADTDLGASDQVCTFWQHQIKPQGVTLVLSNGDYPCSHPVLTNGTSFSTTMPVGPSAPYMAASSPTWDYQGFLGPGGTTLNGWAITMRSRNFLGARFPGGLNLDVKFAQTATQPNLGIRITNVDFPTYQLLAQDSGSTTKVWSMFMADHNSLRGGLKVGYANSTLPVSGIFVIANRAGGQPLEIYGQDAQILANLWDGTQMYTAGSENWSPVTATIFQSAGGCPYPSAGSNCSVLHVTDVSSATRPIAPSSSGSPTFDQATAIYGPDIGISARKLVAQISGTPGGVGDYQIEPISASPPYGHPDVSTPQMVKTYPRALGSGAIDAMDYTVKNSTASNGRTRNCFNTFINAKVIDGQHADQMSLRTGIGTGAVDGGWICGNASYPANPWVHTATDLQVAGDVSYLGTTAATGQFIFNHDANLSGTYSWQVVANITSQINANGVNLDRAGALTVVKNNLFLRDALSSVNGAPGTGTPVLKFSLGGAGASIVVKDNVSTSDKVYYGTGAAGSADVSEPSANVYNFDATAAAASLVNPSIGTAAASREDVIRAFSAKASPADPTAASKLPTADPTKIDLLRHTLDPTWVPLQFMLVAFTPARRRRAANDNAAGVRAAA